MNTTPIGSTMKSRLLALAALVVLAVSAQAQSRINFKFNITQRYDEAQANGRTIEKKEAVTSKMKVFTYNTEKRAKDAVARFNQGYELKLTEGDCQDMKSVNPRGEANNVKADARGGYAVLTMSLQQTDTAVIVPIAKYYEESSNTVTFSGEYYGGKVLKTVESKGKQKARGDKQASARIHGNRVTVMGQIRLDSMYTRDDARFVGVPRLMMVRGGADGKDSVIHYFDSFVFDGLPYERTQYRRMQYDLSHDKLNGYKINRDTSVIRSEIYMNERVGLIQDERRRKQAQVEIDTMTSMFMKERGQYLFDYVAEYGPIDRNKKYNARLHRWYEDYNKVYNDNPDYLFWDGNLQDPMMFLDWSSARSSLVMDPLPYKKEEKSEVSKANRTVKLEFEVGKTSLDMTDSATVAELEGLQKMLQRWYDDENAEVRDIYVKGYASPEGGYANNRTLAAGRAQNLTGILRSQPGVRKVKGWHHDSDVVSWDEVADSLEQVIKTQEAIDAAHAIREITASTKDRDAQARQIQTSEYFNYLKDSGALKIVRRVTITVEYVATRILTPEEIYEKYVTDTPKGYHEGIGEKDYEYYHLMNRLYEEERWDELETISKAAFDNIEVTGEQATRGRRKLNPEWTPEKDGTVDKYIIEEDRNNPYFRPYALAAYYLSCCKLRKEEADTTLLAHFLDDHRERKDKDPDLGQGYGVWNEPSIVVNHILMYCYARDFERAEFYALNWLPEHTGNPEVDEACHNLTMFVRCLNGDEENPEVQEYIRSTSPMNAAVVAAATNTKAGFTEAMNILNDSTQVDYSDAKVHYLKAICGFRLQPLTDYEHPAYPAYNIYDREGDEESGKRDWAAPMLVALNIAPEMEKTLEVDGYFNDAYRRMVKYFRKRLKDGAAIEDICKEYDTLRAKYATDKK